MNINTKIVPVETKPGCWNTMIVEIYNDDKKIGEYKRDYSTLYKTFCPFQRKDEWYALYSPHYEETRVMRIFENKIKDIGSEKSSFCPIEYYVPSYKDLCEDDSDTEWNKSLKEVVGTFGFVSGCFWGDDSTWKIRYVDLSDLKNPKVEEKFGYIHQPNNLSLKECVSFDLFNPKHPEYGDDSTSLSINHSDQFDIDSNYFIPWPIRIADEKDLNENKALQQMSKSQLIRRILKQEKTIDTQRTQMSLLHNLKIIIKKNLSEDKLKEFLKEANPQIKR